MGTYFLWRLGMAPVAILALGLFTALFKIADKFIYQVTSRERER